MAAKTRLGISGPMGRLGSRYGAAFTPKEGVFTPSGVLTILRRKGRR